MEWLYDSLTFSLSVEGEEGRERERGVVAILHSLSYNAVYLMPILSVGSCRKFFLGKKKWDRFMDPDFLSFLCWNNKQLKMCGAVEGETNLEEGELKDLSPPR